MLFSSARSESDVTRGPHRIELGFAEASDRKNQRELLLTNASPRFGRSGQGQLAQLNTSRGLKPNPIDQNPWAHWRSPMDMMRQGWSTSLFHAAQQWSTRSS